MTDWNRYGHGAFAKQMRKEMQTSEADELDRRAQRIDNHHTRISYSSWLNEQ